MLNETYGGHSMYQPSFSPSREQTLSVVDGELAVTMTVHFTHERGSDPFIAECRHAALKISNPGDGYVVYDRLLNRIVNGVFYGGGALDAALRVAQAYNEGKGEEDMSPNGYALGLQYPDPPTRKKESE